MCRCYINYYLNLFTFTEDNNMVMSSNLSGNSETLKTKQIKPGIEYYLLKKFLIICQ